MQADDRCKGCRDSIQPGDVYCDRCADHYREAHDVEHRERVVTDRLHALGWSVSWHGMHGQRWAGLYRQTPTGFAEVSVTLAGRVVRLNARHVNATQLGRWCGELAGAILDR